MEYKHEKWFKKIMKQMPSVDMLEFIKGVSERMALDAPQSQRKVTDYLTQHTKWKIETEAPFLLQTKENKFKTYSVDILLPDLSVGVEVNGGYHYTFKKRATRKTPTKKTRNKRLHFHLHDIYIYDYDAVYSFETVDGILCDEGLEKLVEELSILKRHPLPDFPEYMGVRICTFEPEDSEVLLEKLLSQKNIFEEGGA